MDSTEPMILVVDDDPDLLAIVALHLRRWGFQSHGVESAAGLWEYLEHTTPDVVLLDVMLGDADGSHLVKDLKGRFRDLPVIMITRSHSVEAAVRCMRHGAEDYIRKPLDFPRLRRAVEHALEVVHLGQAAPGAGRRSERDRFHDLVGGSAAMVDVFRRMERIAPADVSVLILGETGTGKELTARALHAHSPRREGPFVAVNAAALPHELIESVLFGHEKGAFTGARQAHVGYCEQADGGTLFLDEIGEMSFHVQAKLLRFLQDHVVQPVGSRRERSVDVRVLAATNVDPRRQMAEGQLREDLYYRLRVVSLHLPPLRQRGGDISRLARHFLERANSRHGRRFVDFEPAALDALEGHTWPGNVRELANVIEEAVILGEGTVLQRSMLEFDRSTVEEPLGEKGPSRSLGRSGGARGRGGRTTRHQPSHGLSADQEIQSLTLGNALRGTPHGRLCAPPIRRDPP